MSVYVDPLRRWGGSSSFRWAWSCHLFADSLDELHEFARRIGLRREWFQQIGPGELPHYDLNDRRRAAALRLGATALDTRAAGLKMREVRRAHCPHTSVIIDQVHTIGTPLHQSITEVYCGWCRAPLEWPTARAGATSFETRVSCRVATTPTPPVLG